jgi:hypothetical protein
MRAIEGPKPSASPHHNPEDQSPIGDTSSMPRKFGKANGSCCAANPYREEHRDRIHYDAQNPAPVELRMLARLELKKRQLLHELAEVLEQYQELTQEIESKKIPVPWLL